MQEHIANQQEFWPRRVTGGPHLIQSIVAPLCGVEVDDLLGRGGEARVAFARQIAMYLMHVLYGHSLTEVAGFFGRHRSTAFYACQKIEDLREDPCFDRQLTQLENLLRSAADIEVTL